MKIIFLDIDGVLNSHDNLRQNSINKNENDDHGDLFDSRCVGWLKAIVEKTGAYIVISSSWRYAGIIRIRQLWEDRKLPGTVIDITTFESFEDSERGNQIKKFVDISNPESYIIIDDDSDMLESQLSNFIHVDGNFGLTYQDYKKSVDILNA